LFNPYASDGSAFSNVVDVVDIAIIAREEKNIIPFVSRRERFFD